MEEIVRSVSNDEDYEEQFQLMDALIREESANNSKRPQTVKLLQCLNTILASEDYEPKTKYYAILMAKDFFLKKYSVFVSCLASSALLQSMTKMAKTIDPRKEVNEKGLNLFPDRALGNRLMTLILECIIKWSEKYPIANKNSGQPTKFRLAHSQLVNEGVVVPKQFVFFPNNLMVGSVSQPEVKKVQSQKVSASQRNSPQNINKSIKLSINKIQGFLAFLRECEDRDEAERQINRYHRTFLQEKKQYYEITNLVIDQGLLDDNSRSILFLIVQFYNSENNHYMNYLENDKDIKTYINEVILSSQTLSAKLEDTNPPQQPPSPRRQAWRKDSQDSSVKISKNVNIKSSFVDRQNQIKPKVFEIYNRQSSNSSGTLEKIHRGLTAGGYQAEYVPDRSGLNLNKNDERFGDRFQEEAQQGAMMVKQVFKDTHQPRSSFIQFRKDLQKERTFKSKNASLKGKSTRRGREANKSSERTIYNSFQQPFTPVTQTNLSRVSIYELYPKVTKDEYSGQVIQSTLNYQYQLQQINANQSLGRFKMCALRERYLLFENEVFQIGFQSSPIYRQHPKYPSLLNITVFIGNTTQFDASEVAISFEGDSTNAIYASPLKIPKLIDGGMQVKQGLLVMPLKFPFNLLNFKLKYRHKQKLYRVNVFLPYMINKFANYSRIDTQTFSEGYEGYKPKQLRTKVFMLSKKIPPSLLVKYIPNSVQINSYRDFVKQRSYCEYCVGMKVFFLNKYSLLIKIIVRPDMTVVIQGVYQGEEEARLQCGILLSTLEFILSDENLTK